MKLDGEKIRLKLAAFFEELCDITLAQVKQQAVEGQLTYVTDNQGNETITRRRGVDTRLLGEAGRGAIRFAQFAGLMDADKSTSRGADVSTNVVFISPQADLTEWETKTVDVTPSESKSESSSTLTHAEASTALQGPTAREAVKAPETTGTDDNSTGRIVQRGLF